METSRSTNCTKKTKSTFTAPSATMAAKGKRAKVTSTKSSSDQAGADPREVITRLESELEVERKSNTQLRREKAREVQQVREVEQNRSTSSQKDLTARLHLEKQRDLEALRETLRSRHETEMVKAIRQKDAEIKRLQRDLLRCQDELKEEIAKRGLSTSARNAFELERAKMLQEIKELTNAKKQLEDALRSAADAEKVRNLEVRQTKENCKMEVAKVEKEAAMEVRKLLEELKSKDHLLAQLDRSQYPDRSNCLRQHLANQSVDELLKISSEIEAVETKATAGPKQEPPVATATPSPAAGVTGIQNISWQKKVYELEKQIRLASGLNHAFIEKNKEVTTINNSLEHKIKNLADENKELNSELSSAKVEMKKMNDRFSGTSLETVTNQLERLRKQIKEQEQVIAQLRFDCQDKDRKLKKVGKPKKAVRFLLPGETVPRAPGFDIDDVIEDGRHGDDRYNDDNADSMSLDSDATCQSSQLSEANLTDDDRELMEPGVLLESVEKDYELLMKEHLALEQSYASLIHSYSVQNDGEPPPEEWKIERESLNLAIWALEQKVRRCEENEEFLRIKLEQVIEEKEELEFKVLEQEQCFEIPEVEPADVEMLESELVLLRNKLDRYERGARASERDVGLQCDVSSQAGLEVSGEGIKVIEPRPSCLDLSVENLSRLGLTSGGEEAENDSGSEMVSSLSTTASSGFYEMASEAEESIVVDAPPASKPDVEYGGKDGADEGEKKKKMATIQENSQSQPPTKTEVTSTEDQPVDAKVESGSDTDRVLEMEATIKSFQAMESSWKTTVEKLERQLQQSLMRERIIRDQVALVEEEKNRRISTLQGQIDVLEDNETRLADTIQALEDMALGVDELNIALESHLEPVPADELERETEKLEASRKQLKDQVEQLVEAGRMLGQMKVKCTDEVTVDEATQRLASGMEAEVVGLVEAVEAALRNSIRHLENVNVQMEEEAKKERELGQRIQHLEESQVEEETVEERRKECPPSASAEVRKAVMECAQIMSTFAVEELQTDLKELRTLLIKLKAVIDSDEADGKVKVDEKLRSSGNKEVRERLRLDVQPMEEWMTITPPGAKVFGEFCDRDQDTTDYELRQKVDEMEKECERLQNLVHEEDQVIRDLHFQNLELRESEKNFQQLVERLEMAEEQMHGKMEEMAEEMERLQGLVKVLEVKERTGRAQLMKHQENELELEDQLEQAMEEMQNGKRKADRKIAELENEKKALIRRTEDQVDRIGDLEGLTGSLKLRIRNLEASDSSLRSEIRKLESELSSAGGALAELEQHREMLAQQVQDLEREKSKLLFEIADLTIDANKQGQKISVLNQEIGKLRGVLVNKDEVISCLQAKLDVAETVLEALRAKVADYESSSLVEEERMEANVRERDQRIRELEEELQQGRKVKGCHQSTQTDVVPIRARIVIEKATSAFRDSFLSLGDRHPLILREFLSASLLPLLTSYEASPPVATAAVSKETMKRFIASLQVDFTSNSRVQVALGSDEGEKKRSGIEAEEERQWSTVEDPRIVHEVRTAENSTHWKNIESRMGLDTDDLALTIEFKDTVETKEIEKPISNANQPLTHDHHPVPPPLPTSSPPPLSPEPYAIKDDAEESADEASEINDEDDGAVPQPCSDSFGPNWSVPHLPRQNDPLSPRHLWPKLVPQASLDSQLENRQFRSRSVDRDCGPLSRNTFQGTELSRIAAGSVESITDSGMDSMQQGTSTFPRDTAGFQKVTRNSAEKKLQLNRDQGTQAGGDGEDEELGESSSVIVLRTQLEQREKELSAKSNQMDRLTVELRRWQREAVAAGEEKSRLSALLGCALKDIKVMRENSFTSPTSSTTPTPTKGPKSPFGFIGWGASAVASERPPPKAAALLPSQIPVSTRHSSSSTSEKDLAPTTKGHSFSPPSRRPTSLLCSSELSQSSSSSLTDGAGNSNCSSSQDSLSQDRRPITTSHLPRPIKEIGSSNYLTSPSSKKEADRLFRQSFEFSRPSSSGRQSETSPCASVSESVGDLTGPLATAAEPTTSTTQGATVF